MPLLSPVHLTGGGGQCYFLFSPSFSTFSFFLVCTAQFSAAPIPLFPLENFVNGQLEESRKMGGGPQISNHRIFKPKSDVRNSKTIKSYFN